MFTQKTVAEMEDLSLETVRNFEEGRSVNASLVDAICVTMESLETNGENQANIFKRVKVLGR